MFLRRPNEALDERIHKIQLKGMSLQIHGKCSLGTIPDTHLSKLFIGPEKSDIQLAEIKSKSKPPDGK